MKSRALTAILAGGLFAAAPVALKAPRPQPLGDDGVPNLEMALLMCQNSGVGSWDLVDFATSLVHRQYLDYSAWTLWETPGQSFARRRGQSSQYNLALAQVLRGLGFEVTVVHAARVRRAGRDPWFHNGHFWLRVYHQGVTRDVCAGQSSNRSGSVDFVPVSEVREARNLTPTFVALGLAPFVAVDVWQQILRRRPPSRWLYRDFDAQP